MKTTTFQKSTILDAPIEAVYAFHENPHNLTKISPSSLRVRRIEANHEAVAGETFRIEASQFFVPIKWEGVWDRAEHPVALWDRALESPFARFRHQHIFESIDIGARTRMTDRVEYALPGGALGRLLSETVVRVVFGVTFAARHRATRDYFAGSVMPDPIPSTLSRLGGWLAAGALVGGLLAFFSGRRRR
jgi:hypothetical protein